MAHLSDEALAEFDPAPGVDDRRTRDHLRACDLCRRRRLELIGLSGALADAGARDVRPARDIVPGAVKRLRLRRAAVANANELLGSIVALLRGLASLASADDGGYRGRTHDRSRGGDRDG